MDELLDAIQDAEFCFFLDDYNYAVEDIAWGLTKKPFLEVLVGIMKYQASAQSS